MVRDGPWDWWLKFERCKAGWAGLVVIFGNERFCKCGGKANDVGLP